MPGDRPSEVVIGRAAAGQLRFLAPIKAYDGSGYTRLPIVVEVWDLSATSAVEFETWGGGSPGFLAFFSAMAAGWRGWDGSREWRDDGGRIELRAEHDGIGTVHLSISCFHPDRPSDAPGSWHLETSIELDPGSLDAVLSDLRALVDDTAR